MKMKGNVPHNIGKQAHSVETKQHIQKGVSNRNRKIVLDKLEVYNRGKAPEDQYDCAFHLWLVANSKHTLCHCAKIWLDCMSGDKLLMDVTINKCGKHNHGGQFVVFATAIP